MDKTASPRVRAQRHAPYQPVEYDPADAVALQAIAKGTATIEQQKRALDWIILKACATYDWPYRPGGEDGNRDTTIALGRQFVGQQIVKMLKLKIGLIQPKGGGT